MKRLLFLVAYLVVSANCFAQSHFGAGVGFYTYATRWYWYRSSAPPGLKERYPIHLFNRPQALVYYESPSIISLGPLRTSLRAEFLYGLGGGTKEDWTATGGSISDGGTTLSGVAGIKISVALPLPTFGLSPYVTPMFHYSLLNSNGQGVASNYTAYNYNYAWDENLYAFALGFGAEFRILSFVINPEYRFFVAGGTDTDWSVTGSVSNTGPSFGAFIVMVGIAL